MGNVTVRYWPASEANGNTGHIALFTHSGGKYDTGHYISYYPRTAFEDGLAVAAEKIISGSHAGAFMPRSYDDAHADANDGVIEITFTGLVVDAINTLFEEMVELPATKSAYESLCQSQKPIFPKKKIKWDFLAMNLIEANNNSHNCSSMTLTFLGAGGIGLYVAFTELEHLIATLIADHALAKKVILFLNTIYEAPEIINGYLEGRQLANKTIAAQKGAVIGAVTGLAAGGSAGAVGGGVAGYCFAKLHLFAFSSIATQTAGAGAAGSVVAAGAGTAAAGAAAAGAGAAAAGAGGSALTASIFAGPPGWIAAGSIFTLAVTLYAAKKGFDYMSRPAMEIGSKVGITLSVEIAQQVSGIEKAIPLLVKATQNIENRTGILSPPSVARLAMMAERIESKLVGRPLFEYPHPTHTFRLKSP